jgi:hypothetical protein
MKGHAKFIMKEKGKEGVERVEKELQKMGYDFDYDKLKKLKFYPLNLYCTELLVIKKIFNYNNEKFKEIGEFNCKTSLLVRLFMKYFVSLARMAEQAPLFWGKYFTVGNTKVTECREKEKRVILRIEDFHTTPLLCEVARGFFSGLCQMIVGREGECKEIKCTHRGDDCHEFLFEW